MSLTCICCKTLEHIIVSNINKHLALENILADCQHGFRSQRSYGIRGSTHKWIDSWLSERSQKVVLDGRASDPVPVLSGVPQGSVLGPVLFLIFINDLPDNIRSSVRLFADDCVLYRNVKSPLDCQILQDDLNSLAKWVMDWQMKFNVSKCHSMRVTRLHPSRHIDFNYTLHQQTLEQVQSAKYLGLTITDDLDEGDAATSKQAYRFQLHTASADIRTGSVR